MSQDQSVAPRPQVRSTEQDPQLQVTAHPVDFGAGIRPAPDANLAGLVEGLKTFNPALEKWAATDQALAVDKAKDQGEDAAKLGLTNAERDKSGLPNDLNPAPDVGLSGTLQSIYRDAYRSGIANRASMSAQQDMLAKYNDQKTNNDFNFDQFVAEQRQQNMAGLPPDMALHMGKAMDTFQNALFNDYEKIRLNRLDQQRDESIGATLRNVVTLDDPTALMQNYRTNAQPLIMGLGKTRAEANQYLVQHLNEISTRAGGRPDIFDALKTDRDEAGFTIYDAASPQLQQHIDAAQHHAQELLDKGIHESVQGDIATTLAGLDVQLQKNPFDNTLSLDNLKAHIGKNDVFPTGHDAAAYYNKVLIAQQKQAGLQLNLHYAQMGQMFMVPREQQKQVMGMLTQGVVGGLSQAISNGDTSGVAALTDALIRSHETAHSNVPSEPIEQMFQNLGETGVTKDAKPSPIFMAGVEVYRRMENNPQLRDVYFNEKTRKVMDSYIAATGGGAEPTAAYGAAYETVSPEAKRREEAFKQTPEFKEKLQSATKWVTGSSFIPRMLGGTGRPDNSGQLVGEAQEFATGFVSRNPSATDSQVQAETQRYMERTFVMDKTSGTAIKIPAGVDPTLAQKAITAYTEKTVKDLGLKDRGSEWGLKLIPDNIQQGTYRVSTAFNGQPVAPVGNVSISQLVDQHRQATLWLPQDAAVLKNAQLAVQKGEPITDASFNDVLTKARTLKVQPDLVKQLDGAQYQAAEKQLTSSIPMGTTFKSGDLFKDNRVIKTDPQQTSASAQRFLNTSTMGGSTGLAASLTTMGEGMALRAYDDPAKGAGKNIAMGYNLKANEATVDKDMRSAGVPAERIAGIKDGSLPLSPEQAERLTMIAVGRHQQLAQAQVNAVQPNLWQKLQPQQQAVLTDIAYQTGNVGQFKKAIASLVSGDMEAFKEQSKVTYVNKAGERVEDVRRNALRNAMLAGRYTWQSVLMKAGTQPGPLDSVALNSK